MSASLKGKTATAVYAAAALLAYAAWHSRTVLIMCWTAIWAVSIYMTLFSDNERSEALV